MRFSKTMNVFQTLLVATLAGKAVSVPLQARQTPATCSTSHTGYLIVRPMSDSNSGPITYVGIVPGVKHQGIDGEQDSIVVTRDDNGNPLQPQIWEFARCTSQDGQAPPPGYTAPTSGPTNNYFGILRPQDATKHCLALESATNTATGTHNSVLDSYCTQVPQKSRTWMYVDYIYGDSSDASNLFFASQEEAVKISNTAHKELQFFNNEKGSGEDTYQLQLLPNPTS